jgi:hypothetical protein
MLSLVLALHVLILHLMPLKVLEVAVSALLERQRSVEFVLVVQLVNNLLPVA